MTSFAVNRPKLLKRPKTSNNQSYNGMNPYIAPVNHIMLPADILLIYNTH